MPRERDIARKVQSLLASIPRYKKRGGMKVLPSEAVQGLVRYDGEASFEETNKGFVDLLDLIISIRDSGLVLRKRIGMVLTDEEQEKYKDKIDELTKAIRNVDRDGILGLRGTLATLPANDPVAGAFKSDMANITRQTIELQTIYRRWIRKLGKLAGPPLPSLPPPPPLPSLPPPPPPPPPSSSSAAAAAAPAAAAPREEASSQETNTSSPKSPTSPRYTFSTPPEELAYYESEMKRRPLTPYEYTRYVALRKEYKPTGKGRMRRVLKRGGCWECRGGGPIPDRNLLQQIADQSYKDVPSQRIGQLELVRATPTLKFYKAPDNTIVVGIRGTKPTDVDDVKADAMIGVGQLESAPRYMRDLQTLQQFQLTYPPSQYDYYGVGHSLGGAILDMFLKNGLIKNGVSYNPAVQPQDFANTTLPNSRVYMESDPLYALMGRNLTKKPETRAPRKKAWWEKAISAIPYVGNTAAKTYDLYQSHMLDQFQGGAKAHSKFATQLKEAGIEPSLYLKEAQRRAKEAGLPYKLLGFADDGEHKLSIPNAEGQMRKFGAVGYGDHLIWKHLEDTKRVPLGTADGHRDRFQKSHSKIKGDWKKDPFSPNNLALKVLW